MQPRSLFLALLLVGCPPVEDDPIPGVVTFIDGTFEPPWLSARNGETVTLSYRPMTAEGPSEPRALRLDERLSWSEPRPLGDGTYAIDVTGADVETFAPIGLFGCDVEDAAPCLSSGSIRGHLRFAGEPTVELRALRPEQSLAVGEVRPWWVFAVDAQGEPSRATVVFESSDPSIFTVDGAILTGLSAGDALLMATADGVSMSWPVTVQATPMGPPEEELILLSEQRVNFEEVAAGTGRLAALNDTPTVVFRVDGRQSPSVVATWTGTGFGYEVLQQTPHDVAHEAHVRVRSDGRLFAAYRSTFPQGITVASRASAPDSEWSFTQLALREDRNDVDSYPGELSDLLVDSEDRVWVVTLTRSNDELSAEDCVTTLRLHELAGTGLEGEEDILIERCDVGVAGGATTLHLMPDPQADRPLVLLAKDSPNLFDGSLHVYRKDGGWWPEYWLGYTSGYFPNSNSETRSTSVAAMRSGDDQESAGITWISPNTSLTGGSWLYWETTEAMVHLEGPSETAIPRGPRTNPAFGTVTEGTVAFGGKKLGRTLVIDPWGAGRNMDLWNFWFPDVHYDDYADNDSVHAVAGDRGRLHFTGTNDLSDWPLYYGVVDLRTVQADAPSTEGRRVFLSATLPIAKQLTIGPAGEILVTAQATLMDNGGLAVAADSESVFSVTPGRTHVFHVGAKIWKQADSGAITSSVDGGVWESEGNDSSSHLSTATNGTDLFVAFSDAGALGVGVLSLTPYSTAPIDLSGSSFADVTLSRDSDGWHQHTVGLIPGAGVVSLLYSGPLSTGGDRLIAATLGVDGLLVEGSVVLTNATYWPSQARRNATDQIVLPGVDSEGPHVKVFASDPNVSIRSAVDLGGATTDVRMVQLSDGTLVFAGTVEGTRVELEKDVRYAVSTDGGSTWGAVRGVRENGGLAQRLHDLSADGLDALFLLDDNQALHSSTIDGAMVPVLLRVTP